MHELLDEARGLLADAVRLRRSIHREPELGLNLPLTQAKVVDALAGLPLAVRTGQRTTSVVADLVGSRPGRAIVLRADMDALPLQEDTGLDFASASAGKMHACGHDAHPVPVACEIVLALQTFVTRSISIFEPGVVTVGKIEAGTTNNVIPETATLIGTVRTLAPATRRHILDRLPRVAAGIAQAHGLDAETLIREGYPVTVHNADFARFALGVGQRLVGAEQAPEQPTPQMAAEDFSYVLEQIPGAMAALGTRPKQFAAGDAPNAHSNRYLLDEDAMVTGMAMYAAVALEFLNRE